MIAVREEVLHQDYIHTAQLVTAWIPHSLDVMLHNVAYRSSKVSESGDEPLH